VRSIEPDPIVVGVRGVGVAAVTWAARQAAIEGRPLRLVHARVEESVWLLAALSSAPSAVWSEDAGPMPAVLDQALDLVEAMRPDQRVSGRAEVASPAHLLMREAGPASTIVVGNHATSALRHLVVGTIWQAVLGRSTCPVVAVTGRPAWPDTPIVVGIDEHGTARAAVEFGYAQAARCGVPLRLCHVRRQWPVPAAVIAGVTARHRLVECAQRYPEVSATAFCRVGDPVTQLMEASADAQLLVVGSRGRCAVRGLCARSVSHALLRRAPCTIAVVPQRGSRNWSGRWR
jgi:nucleotide-binding universal stress UspA family protein